MTPNSLRIIFAGTPEFAARYLEALVASEHELLAIYTQPDRPAGRGKKLLPSPVKKVGLSAGIPVFQPASLKGEPEQQALDALNADLLIVVAYGLILPQAVLDIPRLGALNVHASLLPRWRGAAPIQRAIESGDKESGVTIMQMDSGLDTGNMLATVACPIGPTTTAASLHDELEEAGIPLLLEVLADLRAYQSRAQQQDSINSTYAAKILKSEALIDWQKDAVTLDRQARAFNPFPVSYTILNGKRLKVWETKVVQTASREHLPGTIVKANREGILVQCHTDQLCIIRAQLPGGKTLTAEQILNAKRDLFSTGTRLGEP
jgi:methionyl-tRNA formyltransferase